MFGLLRRDRAAGKKDRVGNFFFQIFGPPTVEGAMQGWSPQARDQYRQMRENQRRAAAARRAAEDSDR
ncbi:hypothetical protein [Dactylosporangium sp. NPDC049140]|jgi:hypothetical protein|uniref:hypothetical protein n=1 Tax=unclassified Dactylosporangium TaxID=2621675 RepID=UPI0033E12CB8